jgi:hypothetical protein
MGGVTRPKGKQARRAEAAWTVRMEDSDGAARRRPVTADENEEFLAAIRAGKQV